MFRLPNGHVEAIKIHKSNITIASLFLCGKTAISIAGCYNAYVHKMVKCYRIYVSIKCYIYIYIYIYRVSHELRSLLRESVP